MQPISSQRIGKHAYNNRIIFRGGIIRETIGGVPFQLRVENPAVEKRDSRKNAAVKRRLYVCCSYSETVIISVKIRCQDTTSED
jgi:hypothetical protein